ncbi:Tat pathway signal protein [Fischerella muscicola CCMEE 5323]|uniref:Tat pathway signal protein n=1 Tax=Fischerella muscicola CCMEE 5323 TaxID=2019572 RepID=A0A2N6JZG9_FISMU|nr:alkaline phosphatase PhoX [Fischerella muscicola]PLZ86759.1 Tat pathway signal protein [Fischerella muscicola CCMEE 5323]
MSITRRDFLLLMGGSAGAVALSSLGGCNVKLPSQKSEFTFQPIKGPIPLLTDSFKPEQQKERYRTYEVVDDLVLPDGYQYQIIATWGDKVGDSRFGYNNDYLSLISTGENEGLLSVNFQYISAIPWMQTYEQVIGKPLPLAQVKAALQNNSSGKNEINAFALADNDPIKAKITEICQEALLDQGLGVISVRKTADGKWERTNSPADRRISGISGLSDGKYLKATGPAVAVFRKQQGQGYIDQLGDRIIGTFGNCAGGTTPWGTVLSAEENFQAQVPEAVYSDGTSLDPSKRPFALGDEELYGQGNVFGLAGNKYGWIVEIDPTNPNDYGTKHTWLGRYRHEAVGVRVEAGKPLAFYSGCDRTGGHIYKFVSRDKVQYPKNKANSQLLTIHTQEDDAGKAFLFATGPVECELTGPCFTTDEKAMFISIQHPGEVNGIRKNQALESREFLLITTTGEEFLQTRQVPIGSNWPGKTADAPPKPAVIVVAKA